MATTTLWADGFEHFGSGATGRANMLKGLWSATGSPGPASANPARTGTYYYELFGNSQALRRSVGARNRVGLAFGIQFPVLPLGSGYWFSFSDEDNLRILTLEWNSDGSISINKDTTTLLDTTEQVLTPGTWHHVEIIAAVSDTVGEIEIRVDGIPVSILTDLDLDAIQITQAIWQHSGTGSSAQTFIDDVVAHTGDDFIGPARVHTTYLTAEMSPFGDWTVTGAVTPHQAVDEVVPDDDTSYIGAENEGDVCTFLMPTLPVDVAEIVAIYIPLYARQSEAGLTRLQTTLISEAEAVDGVEHPITPSYSYVDDAFSVDPATGGPWDKASAEAALLQITRTV